MRKYKSILPILALIVLMATSALAEAVAPESAAHVIDLTPLFQAVIVVLASLITAKVVPWIKARTTADQQATLSAITKTLVFAAEQIYGSGAGKDKLVYVQSKLTDRGYKIDIDEIEAAVRELSAIGADTV